MSNQSVERSRVGLSLFVLLTKASFLTSTLVVLGPIAVGQSVEGRPVARMITPAPNYTRARRVSGVGNDRERVILSSIVEANDIERRAFEQTNLARARSGLPGLVWDHDLYRMARLHSENMARLGFFSHRTPEGLRLRDRARAVGIQRFTELAENIAYNFGYDDPGGFAVERWLISPRHRANVLSTGFQAMAVGTFVASDGSVFLTQVFMTR